jgi:hypothetical protein
MTPLAQHMMTRALRAGDCGVIQMFRDVQMFEVTGCIHLTYGPGSIWQEAREWCEERLFLPAPKTWIELIPRPGHPRYAVLLDEETGCRMVTAFSLSGGNDVAIAGPDPWIPPGAKEIAETPSQQAGRVYSQVLPLLNAPHLTTSESHSAHTGLQRKLTRAGYSGPHFDEGWTEVRLQVGVRRAISDSQTGEICAKKRLHFCRSHLRIRNGLPGIVRAHWRGDATMGTVAKTYEVAA